MKRQDAITYTYKARSGRRKKKKLKSYLAEVAEFARNILKVLWIGIICVTILSSLPLIFSLLEKFIILVTVAVIFFLDYLRSH